MTDYSKKTNAELQELLKSRGLAHSGKKADLVARLNEADKAAQENEVEKAPPAASTTAPPQQEPEPVAAPAAQAPPAETAPVPANVPAEATDSPSANTDTALAASVSYALNLPVSDVDSEMAKRKARAERFGTGAAAANGESNPTDAVDTDAQKALDRAQRFGTDQGVMGKLDEALPAEAERGARRRGRPEEASAMDDPGLRRGFGGRGRGGGRGGRFRGRNGRDNSRRRAGEKPSGVTKPGAVFSNDGDRQAAEARKKRFAAAS